mgnify:CR=1 FL=1
MQENHDPTLTQNAADGEKTAGAPLPVEPTPSAPPTAAPLEAAPPPPAPEPAPQAPAEPSPVSELSRRLDAMEAAATEQSEALEKHAESLKKQRAAHLDLKLGAALVKPAFRDWAAAQVGDVDPFSADYDAAIAQVVANHPEIVDAKAAAAPEFDPDQILADAKAKAKRSVLFSTDEWRQARQLLKVAN